MRDEAQGILAGYAGQRWATGKVLRDNSSGLPGIVPRDCNRHVVHGYFTLWSAEHFGCRVEGMLKPLPSTALAGRGIQIVCRLLFRES